jgi:hypothetical protein
MGVKRDRSQLREERRLKMFETRVLRRIFSHERGEERGEWRKLNNEEFNDMYCSQNVIRVIKSRSMRWAGHVECMGEKRGACRRTEGKIPLGRSKHRREDNIQMYVQEVGWRAWTRSIGLRLQIRGRFW